MAAADPSADSEFEYLHLGHLNIRSLRKKCLDIHKILTQYKIHVLALTETNLDDKVKNSELHVNNFKFYRKDRKGKKGGGVGFYIQNHMTVIQRYDLDHKDLEMIWVEIFLPHKRPLLVGCCYREHDSKKDYLFTICRKIEMVSNEGKDIFLLGDFNIDWLKESPEKTRIDFVSSVCGLTQIIDKATREEEKRGTSTCIDHIYTNISELDSKLVIPQDKSVSDHNLITTTVERRVLQCRNTETHPSLLSKLPELFLINSIIENKHSLEFRRVEKEGVERLFSLVNAYLLQMEAPHISALICHILNSCINCGEFPSERHESFILCQILEKVLLQQIEEYFYKYKLFTHHQTLANITDQWIRDLENNKQVGVVFMDFSSSSDVISHDLLLHKLKSYRFSDSAISMMRSFLSNRNSSSCRWTDTHCELSRGSCMTHFLFSVYTNDLKVTLKSAHVVVSGSQLMMYHSADDYEGLKEVLRKESEVVRHWLRENRMVLKAFTSTVIKSRESVKNMQTYLRSTLSLNVEEFNWIRIVGVLLHDASHLVWTSL